MQAILIIAHRDPKQVLNLAKIMRKRFEVYIHFDKKMELPITIQKNLRKEKVHYYQQTDVHWGGWSIALVAINLMKEALKNPEITYVHVISGQDWPLKPINDIYNYFEQNNKAYMNFFKAKDIKKSGEQIIQWQKYYFPYDNMNRRSLYGKIYHRCSMMFQTLFRVDKFKKLGINMEIYSGSNWCDLPRDIAIYALNYLDNHPNVLRMFQTGCFSDEFWMQTIIGNSKYSNRIDNDIHRYILWKHKHSSYPAILDEEDYENIQSGNYFWGRKFVFPYSASLIDKINKNLL